MWYKRFNTSASEIGIVPDNQIYTLAISVLSLCRIYIVVAF